MKTERPTHAQKKRQIKAAALIVVAISLTIGAFADRIGQPAQQAMAATDVAHQAPLRAVAMSLSAAAPLSRLSVVGTVEAGDMVSVIAPFDGVIKQRSLAFDTQVEQGAALLALDPAELGQRIQEARIAMLKAARSVQELDNWARSSEVERARRNVAQGRQQVAQAERKVKEAEILLMKGIIARSEYDGLIEQLDGFRTQLAAATSDLQSTQEKANKDSRDIARIEYEQAKARFDELSSSLPLAKIIAPRSGIISRAPGASGQAPATLDVGGRITKGQLLFNVAVTDKLRIAAKVDEVDVADLHPGQPVKVSIDAQDMPVLNGRLAEVSAQASQTGSGSRGAVFDIKIDIPELDAQQRQRLRVGMSCNVSIETGKANAARPREGG